MLNFLVDYFVIALFTSMRNHLGENSAALVMLMHDITMPALQLGHQAPHLPYYISPAVPLSMHIAYK